MNWNGPSALEAPNMTSSWVAAHCSTNGTNFVHETRLWTWLVCFSKRVVHVWTISSHQLCSEQYLDASKLDKTKSDLKAMFKHQAFSPRCDLPIVDCSNAFFLWTWRFAQSKTFDSRAKKTMRQGCKKTPLLTFVLKKKWWLLVSHWDEAKRIWLNSNKDMWV